MNRSRDPASTSEPAVLPSESYRAALRWLATSRVAVALVLLAFVPLQAAGGFAAELSDPPLFERVAVVYLLAAIGYLSTLHWCHTRFLSLIHI